MKYKDTRTGNGMRHKQKVVSPKSQASRVIKSIRARRQSGDRIVVLADYHPTQEEWVELARQLDTAEYTDLIS